MSATSGSLGSSGTISNSFRIPFDLSYEIDIWGRVRRSYESSKSQVRASECDLEVVRQTLLADLARNYFALCSFDAQDQVLMRNLALYQEQVDLTKQKVSAGLSNETTALQATVQLESSRADLTDIRRQRADLEHAIAILLGPAARSILLGSPLAPCHSTRYPAGLPSDLLSGVLMLRRPSTISLRLARTSAWLKADFFPSVKLTGSAGFQSVELKDALDWRNRFWSIGPSISIPIFKGGQLRANLQKAKARYDELEATYRNSVLGAFSRCGGLINGPLRADRPGRSASQSGRRRPRVSPIDPDSEPGWDYRLPTGN